MERVRLAVTHCYGIKNFTTELDFSDTQAYAIYAPNGVMKSSLARTFQDASEGKSSEDLIFPQRNTFREILDQNGGNIEGERVLVVRPYDEEYGPTEKTSTLLVDAKLRTEYTDLQIEIEKAKKNLLHVIGQTAGSRRDFEHEIADAFTHGDDFGLAVHRIRDELSKQEEAPFAEVDYDVVFNNKVANVLEDDELKGAIEEYVHRYNELLDASTFFKRGIFDYYNAGQIAKTLTRNGFFDANHTVNLKASGKVHEISSQDELEEVIEEEKGTILQDRALRTRFDKVASSLQKNADLRKFLLFLQNNETLLPHMNNLPKFREDVLKSYLKLHYNLYKSLINRYEDVAGRKKEIEEVARRQRTQWDEVISIFNERFFVPFILEVKNHVDVKLGNEPIVDLKFTYVDGADEADVDKPNLMNVLSTGEKKALYVLNVIFEVERRKKDNQETLMIIDDIADSFDYQNKYAIIQYLDEIRRGGLFKLIVMTHNFDFFRTVHMRGLAGYKHCLVASKVSGKISLEQAAGIRNIFANDWKGKFFTDSRKKIASIPFLRNLVEMTTGEEDQKYLQLTSMLHWKSDSKDITVGQLDKIFNEICRSQGRSQNSSESVHDLIRAEAQQCFRVQSGLNLENKIVLAIAIRCVAERFMIEKGLSENDGNQTQTLIQEFRKEFPDAHETIQALDRVALMTPENIHVNAFMYEPIVDMSDDHLKSLFREVSELE